MVRPRNNIRAQKAHFAYHRFLTQQMEIGRLELENCEEKTPTHVPQDRAGRRPMHYRPK